VDAPAPAVKLDKRGHPTSVKSWTPKSVCGSIFAERVDDEQRSLSGEGEAKDISKYRPALATVFTKLSAEERERCDTLAEEWNAADLPEDVVRK
jgi:hypothetical protein